ncbi:THO2 plays a role in transcriptional elongation [Taxawa tesnikishii (nom. ined.)]|nr:THO2 plays a role in transcriptional elongation [Dothideales sp. JES 119]
MLSKVYGPARPLSDREGLQHASAHIGDPAGMPKGMLNRMDAPSRKTLRWARLEKGDDGSGISYEFYWEDWADNVPVCQTVDDVFDLCNTFLNFSGYKIGRDASLLMKLARIGKHSLSHDGSEANRSRWLELTKRLLVPALSQTSKNPAVVNELFDLLKLYPTATRYEIYAEWHSGPTSRSPEIAASFKSARAETLFILKRISKTNVKPMGRALAKIAYSNPGIAMRTAIQQLQSYTNIIDVVVECTRYFTYLGYDVLTWTLLNSLTGAGRDRVQADGMLTSPWLRALATFAGAVFKRYSTTDPSPVLQYVASELQNGNTTDLEVLEQIITSMAGIRSDMTLNDTQVLAMAGGDVLQAQTLIALADERHLSGRTSKRLLHALMEPGLAGPLLISIAQEWQMYANHESAKDAPLKVLATNLDKIYEVFVQYLDTLRSNLPVKDFDSAVPGITTLISEFGLEPSLAFMIGRASVINTIAEMDAAKKLEQQERSRRLSQDKVQDQQQVSGDTPMTNGEEKPKVNGDHPVESIADSSAESKEDVKMEDAAENGEVKPTVELQATEGKDSLAANATSTPIPSPTPAPGAVSDARNGFWHPALSPIIGRLKEILGPRVEETISLPFYATFWTLSLQDILVNTASYDQEIAHQTHMMSQIRSDRSDPSAAGSRERERKIKAIAEIKDRLQQEMKTQIGAYTQVRNRLNKEKDHWFPAFQGKVDLLHTSILQNCFLPRVLLSPMDAHYTFTMLKFLHNNGAPGFRTMHLYDRLLRRNQLAAIIFQCTSREAENFGRFLSEIFKELQSWHTDKNAYERNAFGAKKQLTGFARKLAADNTPETFLDYEDYRRLLFKWHGNLNGAFKQCFETQEYMHIRNAIIILKAVHQHFPVVNFMGRDMLDKVNKAKEEEGRQDLKLAATSLWGDLKRREKAWMMPQAFRIVRVDDEICASGYEADMEQNEALNAAKAGPQRGDTPQPGRATPRPLNANAAEFKPGETTPTANGDAQKTADAEDGEIDDEKKAENAAKTAESNVPQTAADRPSAASHSQLQPPRPGSRAPSRPSTPAAGASKPSSLSQAVDTGRNLPSGTTGVAPSPATSAPPRPDSSRPTPAQSAPPRPTHALPDRPDSRSASRGVHDRPGDRPGTRLAPGRQEGRDRAPPSDYGRLERPGEMSRTPSAYPREQSPGRRSRARTPDREYMDRDRRDYPPVSDRFDDRGPPLRQPPHDARPDAAWDPHRREPLPPQERALDRRGYPNGNPMPPPANAYSSGRGGPMRPEYDQPPPDRHGRGPPPGAPGPLPRPAEVSVNPERLAMINGDGPPLDNRGPREPRHERDDRRDRPTRPPSPGRYPPRATLPGEDRRMPLDPHPYTSCDRRDEPSDHAPTGPRHTRGGRELFEPAAPAPRPVDMNHGRLNQDTAPPRHQDPSYGRLNAAPEAPSGPKAVNTAREPAGRNFTPTEPRNAVRSRDLQQNAPSPPSTSRPPPTGPHNDRHSSQYDRQQPSSSAPATPTLEQPAQTTGLHPSRLAQMQPAPIQTNNPPSGPRGAGGPPVGTPTGPSPVSRAPSGPASATERRTDRRYAGLNDVLQGNNNNSSNSNSNSNSNNNRGLRSVAMPAARAALISLLAEAYGLERPAAGNQPPQRVLRSMEVVAAEGTTIVKSATIATAPAETKAASEVSETTAVVAEAVSVTVSASMSAMIATTVDREMKRAEVGPIANAAMEMNAARQERINMPRHRWAEHRRCSLLSLHRLMIAATAAVGAEADPASWTG